MILPHKIFDWEAGAGAHVLVDVADELVAQNEKWGEQNHPDYAHDPLFRHMDGSRVKERVEGAVQRGKLSWSHILLEEVAEALDEALWGNETELRNELVQVAAVAAQWVLAIDRRG